MRTDRKTESRAANIREKFEREKERKIRRERESKEHTISREKERMYKIE